MSNTFTALVNLGTAPEKLPIEGREVWKLRACNTAGSKKAEPRWMSVLVSGPDAAIAPRLGAGDTLLVTGELVKVKYYSKTKKMDVEADEMPFARIMRVIKSKTFFAPTEGEAETKSDAQPAEDPLAGL